MFDYVCFFFYKRSVLANYSYGVFKRHHRIFKKSWIELSIREQDQVIASSDQLRAVVFHFNPCTSVKLLEKHVSLEMIKQSKRHID